MRVERLSMKHFRGIRELELEFHPRLNVLVGVNGVGKSSVLDCLAILLSRLCARIATMTKTGRQIVEADVSFGEKETKNKINVFFEGHQYEWQAGKSSGKKLKKPPLSLKSSLSQIADSIHERLEKDPEASVPLAVLYSVDRSVDKVPLKVKKTHLFDQYAALSHSLTGKRDEADFKLFFEWFRNREDVENEQLRNQALSLHAADSHDGEYPDRQLQAVRAALEKLMPQFSDLRVRRKPRLQMVVSKQQQEYSIEQLSDGEKCLLALVGDMARRLAIANPGMQDPLHGQGVFLIDEIELHLHPAWQRMVLPRLLETFPNCQFMITTHSPQVLGEVAAESVFILTREEEKGIVCRQPPRSKGMEAGELLTEILDAPAQDENISNQLNILYDLILEGQISKAQAEIARMEAELGDIPALIKAKTMIDLH